MNAKSFVIKNVILNILVMKILKKPVRYVENLLRLEAKIKDKDFVIGIVIVNTEKDCLLKREDFIKIAKYAENNFMFNKIEKTRLDFVLINVLPNIIWKKDLNCLISSAKFVGNHFKKRLGVSTRVNIVPINVENMRLIGLVKKILFALNVEKNLQLIKDNNIKENFVLMPVEAKTFEIQFLKLINGMELKDIFRGEVLLKNVQNAVTKNTQRFLVSIIKTEMEETIPLIILLFFVLIAIP